MKVTLSQLQTLTAQWKAVGDTIAVLLVSSTPHIGHNALVQTAKTMFDRVVAVTPGKVDELWIEEIYHRLDINSMPGCNKVKPLLDRYNDAALMGTAWNDFEVLADALWIVEVPPTAPPSNEQLVLKYFEDPPHYQDLIPQIGAEAAQLARLEGMWAAMTNVDLVDLFTWDTLIRSEKDGIRSWWQADVVNKAGKSALILPAAIDSKGVPIANSLVYSHTGNTALSKLERALQTNSVSTVLNTPNITKAQIESALGYPVYQMYKLTNSTLISTYSPGKNSIIHAEVFVDTYRITLCRVYGGV